MRNFFVKYQNCFLLSLLLAVVVVFTLNSCEEDKEKEDKLECKTFIPPRGTKNTPVILQGTGFGNDPAAIEVKFNDQIAEVVKCDGNEMIVLTPEELGLSSTITVRKGGDSKQFPGQFTYIREAHAAESYEPLEGFSGTQVTLTGVRFGTDPEAIEVKFNDKIAEVVSCTDTEIVVLTPEYPGNECIVTVKLKGVVVQFKKKFTYHIFTLNTFSPAEAEAGETVTLTGNGFGNNKDVIEVRFNNKAATVVSCSDTQVEVLVPEDPSTNCVITVKKDASLWVSYSETFSYKSQFELTTFAPTEGGTGTKITLNGDKFGSFASDVQVLFGDKPANLVSCRNDRLEVQVPDLQSVTSAVISVKIGSVTKSYSASFDYFSDMRLTSFYPLSGNTNDIITLKGFNFGSVSANLVVKFNEKVVNVISCLNDSVLVRIPYSSTGDNFLAGDECIISVTKGSESGTFSEIFTFTVSMMVSTVAGTGTGAFQAGTLSTARFEPKNLVCDHEGNLIVVILNPNAVILVDVKNNEVRKLIDLPEEGHAPCISPNGRTVYIPGNNQGAGDGNIAGSESARDYYYKVELVNGVWTGVSGTAGQVNLIRPTASEQAAGIVNFRLRAFHHGYAYSVNDGKIYYRSNQDGGIVRFDPVTNKGEWAKTLLPDADGKKDIMFMIANPNQATVPNNDGTGLNPRGDARIAFNPKEPWMLYGTLNQTHRIAYLNIITGESGVFAGTPRNEQGFANGFRTDARFNGLQQIAFDNDGNMIIAEAGGHRIRKIDYQTGMVSTLIGINTATGASGSADGPSDVARVNNPLGVAVGKDGAIYIADRGNGRIRKIVME